MLANYDWIALATGSASEDLQVAKPDEIPGFGFSAPPLKVSSRRLLRLQQFLTLLGDIWSGEVQTPKSQIAGTCRAMRVYRWLEHD